MQSDNNNTLAKSIMNKQELKEYAREFKLEVCDLEGKIIILPEDEKFKNLSDSSNHVARKGVPWIDYWRALTGNYNNGVACACCGKLIYADLKDPKWNASITMRRENEKVSSINNYQADGSHVECLSTDEHLNGVYIVPLCRICNHPSNTFITLRKGSVLCPEVDYTIEE